MESKEYVPCANCGFRLVEVAPSTVETRPSQVVACPICGLRMDDDGFNSGRVVSPDERERLLGEWLYRHGYDPEVVHQRWGFSVGEFFVDSLAEDGSAPLPAGGWSEDVQSDLHRR